MVSRIVAKLGHWVQASRPLAQFNIAVPLLLGQAAAWHVTDRFDWGWFVGALAWGIFDHLFVVFANDYADRDADTGARTNLSGGSGVVPEGKIAARTLGLAAVVAGALVIGWSFALGLSGRPWTPIYAAFALALVWAYSFGPLRLSYRGGGELLQGIGLGVGLPSLGFYLQTEHALAPIWVLGPATVLGVCGNIATAIPDENVDRQAGKRTWPVRFGLSHAQRAASAGIAFAAFGVFLWTPTVSLPMRAAIGIAPLVPLLIGARARTPLAATWAIAIALNVLLGLWTVALLVPTDA